MLISTPCHFLKRYGGIRKPRFFVQWRLFCCCCETSIHRWLERGASSLVAAYFLTAATRRELGFLIMVSSHTPPIGRDIWRHLSVPGFGRNTPNGRIRLIFNFGFLFGMVFCHCLEICEINVSFTVRLFISQPIRPHHSRARCDH